MKESGSPRSKDERPAVGAPGQAIYLLRFFGYLPALRESGRRDPEDSVPSCGITVRISHPFPIRRPARRKAKLAHFVVLFQTVQRAQPQRVSIAQMLRINHPLPIRREARAAGLGNETPGSSPPTRHDPQVGQAAAIFSAPVT